MRRLLPLLTLLAVAIAHALPALLNAARLHSDAAIVGLQARHLLHGEWSWFLWGSGYQTSADSVVVALLFLVLGSTPLALTLAPFLEYLLLVAFVYFTLRRRFEAWSSALLVAPLVVATGPLHIYMFSPPRQTALTLAFAAVYVMDGAPLGKRPGIRLAAGGLLAGLACFADPYALLFLPALFLFLAITVLEVNTAERLRSLALGLVAAIVGLVPVWLLTHSAHAARGVLKFDANLLAHNLDLLQHQCLPFLLGTTAYFSPHAPLVQVWPAPLWFRVVQLSGAALLLSGIVFGGFCALSRRFSAPVRRLAALGAIMLPLTLIAFLVSVMVMDCLSARYLVAIVLMSPFALAPALASFGARRFALLLAPYLLSATVAGWLGQGWDVHGLHIRRTNERTSDESALHELLRARGISAGMADYWVAYRLTFLFNEGVIFIPRHERLDRYAPYREELAARNRVAYVYDPWRSKEDLAKTTAAIEADQTAFRPKVEVLHVGRYTVLILERKRKGLVTLGDPLV